MRDRSGLEGIQRPKFTATPKFTAKPEFTAKPRGRVVESARLDAISCPIGSAAA